MCVCIYIYRKTKAQNHETGLRPMSEESRNLNALNIRGTSLPRQRHRNNMIHHDVDFSDCPDLWIEKPME